MKGWNFKDWLKGNWTTLLELVKIGSPLLLGLAVFKNNPALIGLVTGLGKLVLDSIHYWINK
jgi:hypothetical protein